MRKPTECDQEERKMKSYWIERRKRVVWAESFNPENVKNAAKRYLDMGIPVLPVSIKWNDSKHQYDKEFLVILWKQWETEQQTTEQFERLAWHKANGLALVLGHRTDKGYLAVVDYDTKGKCAAEEVKAKGLEILRTLPDTLIERTVNGGLHYIYFSEKPVGNNKSCHDNCGLELLGSNLLIVMSPSQGYEVENDKPIAEVTDLGKVFADAIKPVVKVKEVKVSQAKSRKKTTIRPCVQALLKSGNRHFSHDQRLIIAFEHLNAGYPIGAVIELFSGQDDFDQVYTQQQIGHAIAQNYQPYGCDKLKDIDVCIGAACKKYKKVFEEEEKERPSEQLITLVSEKQVILFRDQYNEPFACVPALMAIDDDGEGVAASGGITAPSRTLHFQNRSENNNKPEVYGNTANVATNRHSSPTSNLPMGSEAFKTWLCYVYWQTYGRAISRESVSAAINVLAAKASCEGKQHYLFNRVASVRDEQRQLKEIWLDMADSSNQAIKVTVVGWEVVTNPPILFRRYPHQQPLFIPDPSATVQDAWRILDFMNIDDDQSNRLMIMVAIISYLIADIPHPLLMVSGPQGSCKSAMGILIKKAIDPSITELLEVPKDRAELILQLEQNWITIHDNLTLIPGWMSDAYCRAVTGGSQMRRKLYTDADSVIAQFKRPIIINGINSGATKGDLLDRSIPIVTPPMPTEKRKEESVIISQFNAALPLILGGFLAVLVEALRIYPTVDQKTLQRLADFHKWGIAISIALGKTQEDFNNAYAGKVSMQLDEALNADKVALLIEKFVEENVKGASVRTVLGDTLDYWEGSPTDFFDEIKKFASTEEMRPRDFPKSVSSFTRRVNMAYPSLHSIGIDVCIVKGTGGRRRVTIDAKNFVVEAIPSSEPSTRGQTSFEPINWSLEEKTIDP